ncbi:MarR family winged helix-turn-helix transcriptional regulator [Halorubrum ezzemoulense]|uniref:MarR family winged helix-turn-helix transcriptional regulator n=1 Tax=Halorubrum ezzemoulense TaxID=337243 RepID=UPI002330A00F|nr:MarR family winged helix-turn-helix transcriptional regulator [Halorubrum ezzemoulense]MDB2243017.1 MarR family winged helix-turn-helix transcriptional regulator [Halorubrum ezzemoulense]
MSKPADSVGIDTASSGTTPGVDAGITYSQTPDLDGIVVRDTEPTATGLWTQLVDPWDGAGLAGELVTAVRDLLADRTAVEARELLDDVVGEALDGALVDVLCSLTRDWTDRWFWKAVSTLAQLGSGRPMGFRSDLEDIHAALAPLVESTHTPTVSIRLPDGFRNVDAETRRSWCHLVAALSQAADVRLICSGVDRAWLAHRHRDDLPGVSDRSDAGLDEDLLTAALDVVDVGSRHARTLSLIAEEDTETLAFSRLYSEFSVGRSRVRQVIGDLVDVKLVETYDSAQDRRVELTTAGRQFFETEIAAQQRLGERVSESGKLSKDSRVNPRIHGEGRDRPETAPPSSADRHRLPSHHETRYSNRRTAAAALGTAVEGGISVVNYPVTPQDDRAEGRWHHDDGRLVVTAEGDNPLQVWTTLALALTDCRTFDRVLTKQRLEDHGVLDMLKDGEAILRGMRNIGWLPDEIDSYDDLRGAFLEAATELGELTRKYAEADDDDDGLRGPITRNALGLAGSMTHLLDLVDVELTRVLKLPEYSRRFDEDRRDALFRSLAIGSAIGSRYGHHVAYRQLFEERSDKRQQAFDPTVDAADPWARLIGSWTLVGDFAGQTEAVADALREHFGSLDPHDDAPEIAIRSEVRTEPTRRQVAETARRMLATKDLQLTPEATSVLHGLARTPFDVADAIQYLAGDNEGRRVDAAEVRYVLAQLEPGRLLRGFDGRRTTPRKLVSSLLEAERPITGTELDERADVSSRSRRDHLADLVEVGLAEETGRGYRLTLSFDAVNGADAERYTDVWPALVADPETSPSVHVAAKVLRVGREYHGPGDPVETVGWPYTGVSDPPDLRELSTSRPYLDDILPALWGVRERTEYVDDPGVTPALSTAPLRAGPPIDQTALQDVTDEGATG